MADRARAMPMEPLGLAHCPTPNASPSMGTIIRYKRVKRSPSRASPVIPGTGRNRVTATTPPVTIMIATSCITPCEICFRLLYSLTIS